MKLRILLGALLWTFAVSALHVHLNIGWGQVREVVREWLGYKRMVLDVGFLPVT